MYALSEYVRHTLLLGLSVQQLSVLTPVNLPQTLIHILTSSLFGRFTIFVVMILFRDFSSPLIISALEGFVPLTPHVPPPNRSRVLVVVLEPVTMLK